MHLSQHQLTAVNNTACQTGKRTPFHQIIPHRKSKQQDPFLRWDDTQYVASIMLTAGALFPTFPSHQMLPVRLTVAGHFWVGWALTANGLACPSGSANGLLSKSDMVRKLWSWYTSFKGQRLLLSSKSSKIWQICHPNTKMAATVIMWRMRTNTSGQPGVASSCSLQWDFRILFHACARWQSQSFTNRLVAFGGLSWLLFSFHAGSSRNWYVATQDWLLSHDRSSAVRLAAAHWTTHHHPTTSRWPAIVQHKLPAEDRPLWPLRFDFRPKTDYRKNCLWKGTFRNLNNVQYVNRHCLGGTNNHCSTASVQCVWYNVGVA